MDGKSCFPQQDSIAQLVADLQLQGVSGELIVRVVRMVEVGNLSRDMSRYLARDRQRRKRKKDKEIKQLAAAAVTVTPRDKSFSAHNIIYTSQLTNEEVGLIEEVTVRKEEKKVSKTRARKHNHSLPDDWAPNQKHYDVGFQRGLNREAVDRIAEDMRIWAGSNGAVKADWDLTFHGFIRRDFGNHRSNGTPSNGFHGKPNDFKTALGKLRDSIRQDECGQAGGELPLGLLPSGGFQ